MSDTSYGLWAGLGVDNTAEATAAGALYSDAAGKVAVAGQDRAQRHDRLRRARVRDLLARKQGSAGVGNKAAFLWKKFPNSCWASWSSRRWPRPSFFPSRPDHQPSQSFAMGFPADLCRRGLRTNISDMRKQGLRPFLVGAIGEVAVAG